MKQRQKRGIDALTKPYNPLELFKPVKRTEGMIDLSSSFLEDYAANLRASEARMAHERRLNESVEIISELPEPMQPRIPVHTEVRYTWRHTLSGIMRVVNPMRFRP